MLASIENIMSGIDGVAIAANESVGGTTDIAGRVSEANMQSNEVMVLLKDELTIDGVKENKTCSKSLTTTENEGIYEGLLIKESIDNEDILDYLNVNKVELWKTNTYPRYWTAITFSSNTVDLPEKLSKVMIQDDSKGGNWFVDFKRNNIKYIVFRGLILKYTVGNTQEKNNVIEQCRIQGIPESQMNWSE